MLHKELRFALTQMGFRVSNEAIARVWAGEIEGMFADWEGMQVGTKKREKEIETAKTSTTIYASASYAVEV